MNGLRRVLYVLLALAVIVFIYAAMGGFESPKERVASITRQCQTAMVINMIQKAEKYCGDAVALVMEKKVQGFEAAEAYGQMAVLKIIQAKYQDGANACAIAIPLWQEEKNIHLKRSIDNSISKCRGVIDDVNRRFATGTTTR